MDMFILKHCSLRKGILITLATVILTFTMVACGNSDTSGSFTSHIEHGNYSKAIEIYNERFAGNSQYENHVRTYLREYFEEGWNDYKAGIITEQEFMNCYTTVDKVNEVVYAINNLDVIYSQYLSVKASKEAYARASEYLAQGNLASAIGELSEVISTDTENYEQAKTTLAETVEKYQDEIVANAKHLASSGNYEEAVYCIRDAEYIVGYITKLESFVSDLYTQKYTDTISTAYNAGNYVTVIEEYFEAHSNDYVVISSDLTSIYSSAVSNYLETINNNAEAAFGEDRDYSSAIRILQSAIADVTVDTTLVEALNEKIEYYQTYIPVSLTSLEYIQKARYIYIDEYLSSNYMTDVNGNEYDVATMIRPYGMDLRSEVASSEDEAYVLYNLNYKYSTLSGVVYRPYHSLKCEDEWTSSTVVKIYGDDVLLYEAPEITQSTYDSYSFEIDVSGVRNLKIVMMGVWTSYDGWGFYSRYPKVCMAEVMLQK